MDALPAFSENKFQGIDLVIFNIAFICQGWRLHFWIQTRDRLDKFEF